MKWQLLPLALVAIAALTEAQTPQQFEETLKSNPHDRAARKALLDYYFLNSAVPAEIAKPARRRHILWLIANTPWDELAGTSAATIDAAGHRLADPQGFKLASDAWRAQTAKPDATAATLANAAYFFKLSEKRFTMSLLERAVALEPGNKNISAGLGEAYAMAIMGVTMVNKNGYPLGADPVAMQSPTAKQAHDALGTSTNPYVLAVAGYQLSFQGAILRATGQLAFDTGPLAESVLQRAVSVAPNDPDVASYMQQHREIQRTIQAARR